MSASPHVVSKVARSPDVLGELLHSLSQPLTSLQCSLELSLDNSLVPSFELSIEPVAERRRENILAALQETGKVIGMVQLMREYLDAEQPGPEAFSSALQSTLRSVIQELSSIAAVRAVRLFLVGTCTARLRVVESRLRLALQYLITTMIEAQTAGGTVVLLLAEKPDGTVLRGEGERGFRELAGASATLRRVRLAIAARILEGAGASLVLGDADSAGFVLSIPRRVGNP